MILFSVLGVIAGIVFVVMKWGNFENKFSVFMNKNSWGLYVFHYFPLAVSAWYLHIYAPELAPVIVYVLVAISAFVGAYVINAVVSRIPFVRWALLGMKKEK